MKLTTIISESYRDQMEREYWNEQSRKEQWEREARQRNLNQLKDSEGNSSPHSQLVAHDSYMGSKGITDPTQIQSNYHWANDFGSNLAHIEKTGEIVPLINDVSYHVSPNAKQQYNQAYEMLISKWQYDNDSEKVENLIKQHVAQFERQLASRNAKIVDTTKQTGSGSQDGLLVWKFYVNNPNAHKDLMQAYSTKTQEAQQNYKKTQMKKQAVIDKRLQQFEHAENPPADLIERLQEIRDHFPDVEFPDNNTQIKVGFDVNYTIIGKNGEYKDTGHTEEPARLILIDVDDNSFDLTVKYHVAFGRLPKTIDKTNPPEFDAIVIARDEIEGADFRLERRSEMTVTGRVDTDHHHKEYWVWTAEIQTDEGEREFEGSDGESITEAIDGCFSREYDNQFDVEVDYTDNY